MILKFSYILLILLPPSLITGPFLPDLFISLMGLIYLFYNFKKLSSISDILSNKLILLFILFYLLIMLSTVLSYDPIRSLESSLFYFRYLFFSLCVIMILNHDNRVIDYLIYSFFITFLILYLDILIQISTGTNLTGYPIDDHGGINSFFGTNADGILGSYTVRLTPLFASLLAYKFMKQFNFIKYLILLLILISSVIALLAQERTALILSFIPFFIFLFLTNDFKFIEKILFILLMFLIIFILIFTNEDLYLRFITSFINQMNSEKGLFIFSELHQAHYLSSLKMFYQEPFFGIGPKMFRYYCDSPLFYVPNSCSTHPHNSYIQLLAETGIFAFMLVFSIFLYLIFLICKQAFRLFYLNKITFRTPEMLLISSIIISLWPIAPTGNFFNNYINVIYFMPVGFLFYFLQNKINT